MMMTLRLLTLFLLVVENIDIVQVLKWDNKIFEAIIMKAEVVQMDGENILKLERDLLAAASFVNEGKSVNQQRTPLSDINLSN